ncbi:MAG: hypothetical protein DHS20C13_22010 [Thermodesulfobacteriota bacterium]|nr:MAG: hypothetical protein DHS20C13_22010 [Thermodesulfobacteriota bacterium]
MTEKDKGKEKPKTPKKRKTVSTFSKMREKEIENQKKQLKALFGTSNNLFDHLDLIRKIQNDKRSLGFPSEQELEEMRRLVENIPDGLEEVIRIRESIPEHLIDELKHSLCVLESQEMLKSMLSIDKEEINKLEGMLMNLPIHDIQKSLGDFSTLNIDIKEFKPVKPAYDEFILHTITRENIEFGNIKLRTVQDTQLQVQSLKGDVKEIKDTIIQDAKKKDEMLEELLDYFKNGGSNTVIVTKVKYNKKTAELSINKHTINIKADTNEHYLCKLLFANKENIKKAWEVYDIVEAWGENTEILEVWIKVIYNTIRRLNEKIQLSTGLERFILYESKTVLVNPNYLALP